ncbi:hypothetical protein HK097_005763 [Rhizophlyctis rosea]|uniref:V-SNARE coiled-coil homology domain-containing protein n=1 Tax=Rhizophlyctis rosea TaxID=64517 RepID=A0AAD5SM60_9FUNG|nr:hypothetical protein HK097_005763 [Rhizophlyctis rosea]
MQENIHKVMARGEQLDTLNNKTGYTQSENSFNNRLLRLQDVKMKLILAAIIAVIIIIIVVSVVQSNKSNNNETSAPPPS